MNLPNKLTVLRMVLIPFVMFFYLASFIPVGKIVAIVLFAIAAITDFLDGKIARSRNMVTDFGKFLDPIADKLLVACVLFMIVIDHTIPQPWGVICVSLIIGRELIIDAFRLIASTKGKVLAADMLGKIKTSVQCWTMPLCILLSYLMFDLKITGAGLLTMQIICYFLIGICTVLTVWSGINYFVKNQDVIATK